MNLLSDIITYVRRIIKSPSNGQITDNLIIDYINRFWIMDVDARVQLFDLKTLYQFQTTPNVDRYNMPLYNVQVEPGAQTIGMYPVYQGFTGPARINGIDVGFSTQHSGFNQGWNNILQNQNVVAVGNGTVGPYTIQFPFGPGPQVPINSIPSGILRGHVDISGIIATGVNQDPPLVFAGPTATIQSIPVTSVFSSVYITSSDVTGANVIVQDSGQFLADNINCGLLMAPGNAPFGNTSLAGGYSDTLNVVDYSTGIAYVTFPTAIPAGQDISMTCFYINPGLPRSVLFYNNIITLRTVPDTQYLVELDAYLSPAAFLNTGAAIQFGYMAEYIARGAARKMLADTGDADQFQFYEPLFREQETLVWKRSQRQFTSTRTGTLFSQGNNGNGTGGNVMGQGQI